MASLIVTILLAIPTSIGVGLGIEFGKDIYAWIKSRRHNVVNQLEKIRMKDPLGIDQANKDNSYNSYSYYNVPQKSNNKRTQTFK